MLLMFLGMQRIHKSRCKPVTRAESYAANSAEGDRPHGVDHPSQVHGNRAAAEAEYMRSSHDIAFTFS